MKKALLILAIAAGGYYLFSGKASAATTDDDALLPVGGNDSPFAPYNGNIIQDAHGRWIYVSGGLLHSITDQFWAEFQKSHPGYSPVVVNQDIWDALSVSGSPWIGGPATL